MVWAKLDDEILDNEKITQAGVLGFAMHVAAITWCCRKLTDGFLPYARVRLLLDLSTLDLEYAEATDATESAQGDFLVGAHTVGTVQASKIAERLISVGLWREDKERGGYWIHDFLDYNPSREEAEKLRAARSEAGQRGARAKASAQASAKANAKQVPEQTPGKRAAKLCPDPVPDPVPDTPSDEGVSPRVRATPPEPQEQEVTPDPPEWFLMAVATAEGTGETIRPKDAWLRYSGHRANKGVRPGQQDAVYWLTTVMVPEARKERREAAERRERDAKFDRERAQQREVAAAPQPYHRVVKPPKAEPTATPEEQAEAMAKIQNLFKGTGT